MSTPPPSIGKVWGSGESLVSEKAFKVWTFVPIYFPETISIWVCTSLCIALAVLRFLIRLVSFRRLFIEDYFMIFSLITLIALAAILQHFLGDLYTALSPRSNVTIPEDPNKLISALRTEGIAAVLSTVGIWAIKFNFLWFFRGFGRQIKTYMVLWWISFFLVAACGIAQLGIIPYRCTFRSLYTMMRECSVKSGSSHIYRVYLATVAIDITSDGIIFCFPVFIIWRSKINLRQKVFLTGIFLLVGFTIIVTVLRGITFRGVGKRPESHGNGTADPEWMLFCFLMQYTVSFVIACIISFRSLWVSKEKRLKEMKEANEKKHRVVRVHEDTSPVQGAKSAKWQKLQGSLIHTMWELEGVGMGWDGSYLINLEPPSGRLTVDFSQWDGTAVPGSSAYVTASTQYSQECPHTKAASDV